MLCMVSIEVPRMHVIRQSSMPISVHHTSAFLSWSLNGVKIQRWGLLVSPSTKYDNRFTLCVMGKNINVNVMQDHFLSKFVKSFRNYKELFITNLTSNPLLET